MLIQQAGRRTSRSMGRCRKNPEFAYHSALTPQSEAVEIQRCKFAGGVAFQHDIRNGVPDDFGKCDVFYGEPPWQKGFQE